MQENVAQAARWVLNSHLNFLVFILLSSSRNTYCNSDHMNSLKNNFIGVESLTFFSFN